MKQLQGAKQFHAGEASARTAFKRSSFSGRLLAGALAAYATFTGFMGIGRAEEPKGKPPAAKIEPKAIEEKPVLLARADGAEKPKPPAEDGNPILLAQADKAPLAQVGAATTAVAQMAAAMDEELKGLPTVRLSELEKLDFETEINGYRPMDLTDTAQRAKEKGWWHSTLRVDTEATTFIVNAFIGMMEIDGKLTRNSTVGVNVNGEIKAVIELKDLARLYVKAKKAQAEAEGKKFNPRDARLRYVKLIAETGVDPQVGEYIQVHVVPVSKPNGEIEAGMPMIGFAYYQGAVWGGTEKSFRLIE